MWTLPAKISSSATPTGFELFGLTDVKSSSLIILARFADAYASLYFESIFVNKLSIDG